jgi:hypothetical protein
VAFFYILAFWSSLHLLTAPLSRWWTYISVSMAASYGSSDSRSTPHQRASTSLTIHHTPTTTSAHSHKTRPAYTNCPVENMDPDTAIEHELEPQIEPEPELDSDTHPSSSPSAFDLLRHPSIFSTRQQPKLRALSASIASARQLQHSAGQFVVIAQAGACSEPGRPRRRHGGRRSLRTCSFHVYCIRTMLTPLSFP